jgi:hypothetical protein
MQGAAEVAAKEVAARAALAAESEQRLAAAGAAADAAAVRAAADLSQRQLYEEQRLLGNSMFPSRRPPLPRTQAALPAAASCSNCALVMLKLGRPAEAESD